MNHPAPQFLQFEQLAGAAWDGRFDALIAAAAVLGAFACVTALAALLGRRDSTSS